MQGRGGLVLGSGGGVLLNLLLEPLGGDGLGPLDGETEGAVEHQAGQNAEGARHTEEHGVVVLLLQAVVLEQDTAVGVDEDKAV